MKKSVFKRGTAMVMAMVMCLMAFLGSGPLTAHAAGEKAEVYMIGFPRDGEADFNGWGHPELHYMNGWVTPKSSYTNIRAMNSYEGNICYCIEPGIAQDTGEVFTSWDENFWDNFPEELNPTITGDEIKTFIGRILQYGYTGPVSLSWRSQNSGGDTLAYAVATQLLIWETIVGERNSDFGKVDPGSYDAILDSVTTEHPLYDRIRSYYDSIETNVKKHSKLPSFFAKSTGKAQEVEMEWTGSEYVAEITDSNGVLDNYSFTANVTGIEFAVDGSTLRITAKEAPTEAVTITASKKNSQRMGVITWTDGDYGPNSTSQDTVTYAQSVSDPVKGYLKLAVSFGSAKLVKTSEDGIVEGVSFTITGEGISQTVTTNKNGEFQIDNLAPGTYTVTEQTYDKYETQESQQITVVSGQVATVTFNNTLKRGSLAVYKNSEDGLNEGVTFHLYGTSLSGHTVDEYAVTDSDGIAFFGNILIGSGYTLEEVDTATKYVIPDDQTAAIEWNTVTNKSFSNILKKWNVTVTKSDASTGTAQGDGSLAGAEYGVYKGDQLIGTYTTDANGQFTTGYYVCGDDWTIREITPSEGYLLDTTIYPVGAEARNYTVELNSTTLTVLETVKKGSIAIIKHTDNGETQIETPEEGAEFCVYLKSAGSYDAAAESERDYLTCDENGFAQTKELPYGLYTVHQVSGWDGRELIADFDVFISENGEIYRYLINNAAFESFLKVIKVDAETGKVIPYEILAIEDNTIRLFDPEFPLFNQEMSRKEFLEQLATSAYNDRYLQPIENTVPDAPSEPEVESEVLPIGRIEYLHTDGRIREQIEYTDAAQMEKDLREENFAGVPMQVTMYVDRQGKTVPHRFVYEMDPPLHGTSVIMNPHIQGGLETTMEKAMRLINEFCESEYESPADFTNMRAIGIGHTTITDAEIPVQINANLVDFSLDRFIEGVIVDRRKYSSLDDLIKQELEWLDFESLTSFSNEELAKVSVHSRENEIVATYHSDDERIDIYHYVNGYFYNHYGSNPDLTIADSIAGPFDSLEEAQTTLLRHRPQAKEGEVPEMEQSFIDCYYVIKDLAVQGPLEIEEYDTLFLAMQAYSALPTDKMKALGIRNTMPLPGSLDLLQCKDGVDTIVDDYLKVDGWQNEEILGAVNEIKKHIAQQEKPLAPPAPRTREKTASTVLLPSIPDSDRTNFRIRNDDLGVGTPAQRYANNVAAIKLLKKLEAEERLATREEQEVLSQYVGWGGLAHWFDDRHPKYQELKSLLTAEEYTAARESTLTAFYTPPVVIRAMYQALENMNFRNGNILEPSCGVGNFISMVPDSMNGSKVYGVELDSISGRIAQQLYQKSSIAVQGYEKTDLPDSFFDAAIGNVPFGQFKVSDKRYDKHNFLIHDYFFARTLDKVRPGGIVAFITSKGTMDKENPAVRKYIAQRADLLGAIRLPNNTFKNAAGTEVTSDILFLQKRDRLIDREPDWVYLRTDANGLKMNGYFVENPDMIMGEMKEISGPYGPETACIPYEDQDLGTMLSGAIQNIHADFVEYELDEQTDELEDLSIPADPTVRNFSYTIADGTIYYRENSRMNPVEVSMTAANRIKGMIGIRDCVRKLIEYQTEDYPNSMIQAEQQRLNELYDDFSEKYGRINSRANNSAFSADSSFCLLTSLEIMDDEGNFLRKADMFSKRTIRQKVVVTSVDTASEALALSLAEKAKIDMEYMTELTGKTEEQLYADLQGVIFLNPDYVVESHTRPKYLPADEYLSGNVREKLAQVKSIAEHDPEGFASHVQALEAVQPVDLTASEISIRLGATWLPTDVVEDFMFHLLSTPRYMQWNIHVHYSQYTGEWNIEGKSVDRVGVKAHNTYGTGRINAYKIIEDTLNLKDVRIFDYVEDNAGKRIPVLNKKETAIAQGKQELIKQAFADWIWDDPSRRERLTKLYNEKFNSLRPREYDGSHLNFVGMNPEITLRPHQVNAIAHILYGGNTLLAHVVGAGKSATRS